MYTKYNGQFWLCLNTHKIKNNVQKNTPICLLLPSYSPPPPPQNKTKQQQKDKYKTKTYTHTQKKKKQYN